MCVCVCVCVCVCLCVRAEHFVTNLLYFSISIVEGDGGIWRADGRREKRLQKEMRLQKDGEGGMRL